MITHSWLVCSNGLELQECSAVQYRFVLLIDINWVPSTTCKHWVGHKSTLNIGLPAFYENHIQCAAKDPKHLNTLVSVVRSSPPAPE